jgi:hypothetical protein
MAESRRVWEERVNETRPARRALSAGQVRAIFDAMRTFRDDDLSRRVEDSSFTCDRCGRRRPPAGSLRYGELHLCNGCATDYELLRTAGFERDLLSTHESTTPADDLLL